MFAQVSITFIGFVASRVAFSGAGDPRLGVAKALCETRIIPAAMPKMRDKVGLNAIICAFSSQGDMGSRQHVKLELLNI
jgi:hypothetical protein